MGKTLYLLSQSQLVNAIKGNDSNVLKQFYLGGYNKVETMVLKNFGSNKHAKQIYQEAFITVWKHIKNNEFKPQDNTDLQAYLFKIANIKLIETSRVDSLKKTNSIQASPLKIVRDTPNENSAISKLEPIMLAFKNLNEPCKKLLKSFYFEKKTSKEIASKLKIEESAVLHKKYNCMEKLCGIIWENNNK